MEFFILMLTGDFPPTPNPHIVFSFLYLSIKMVQTLRYSDKNPDPAHLNAVKVHHTREVLSLS